jgi:hypothetical protein
MAGRVTNRSDVIARLNGLVRQEVIVSFRTDLFDKDETGSEPTVTVTVQNPKDPEPVLQRVREALEPLGFDLTVRGSTWQSRT